MLDRTTVDATSLITKEKLVAWLETMPPEEVYIYISHTHCLIAQFLESEGAPSPFVAPHQFTLDGGYDWDRSEYVGIYYPLPPELDEISRGNYEIGDGQTFGGALQRLKQLA